MFLNDLSHRFAQGVAQQCHTCAALGCGVGAQFTSSAFGFRTICKRSLAEGDIVTIAGLALARRGIVPEQGESIALPGYRLTVEQTEGFKITQVKLEPVK